MHLALGSKLLCARASHFCTPWGLRERPLPTWGQAAPRGLQEAGWEPLRVGPGEEDAGASWRSVPWPSLRQIEPHKESLPATERVQICDSILARGMFRRLGTTSGFLPLSAGTLWGPTWPARRLSGALFWRRRAARPAASAAASASPAALRCPCPARALTPSDRPQLPHAGSDCVLRGWSPAGASWGRPGPFLPRRFPVTP